MVVMATRVPIGLCLFSDFGRGPPKVHSFQVLSILFSWFMRRCIL